MYKIINAFKKCKKVFIIVIVLWIILSIVFVAPMAVAAVDEGDIVDNFINNISDLKGCFLKAFSKPYIKGFGKGEMYLSIALVFCAVVGIIKSMPKNEYTDIEHGSSDWASGGEQYKILSPRKGILLAEKNFLPVDKRGNVNVLIVGRIWFW